jgi:hypothetical protein
VGLCGRTLDILEKVNELSSMSIVALHVMSLWGQRNLDASIGHFDACVGKKIGHLSVWLE